MLSENREAFITFVNDKKKKVSKDNTHVVYEYYTSSYIVVRRIDELNETKTERLEALSDVCRKELAYLDGDYLSFDDGKRYTDASHPFATDIFGPKSLYQRVSHSYVGW